MREITQILNFLLSDSQIVSENFALIGISQEQLNKYNNQKEKATKYFKDNLDEFSNEYALIIWMHCVQNSSEG